MSTIIAHTYMVIQRRPRKCVAGMLLCAILSDTLNLMGPTTTDWDRMMVAILCELAGVTDIDALVQAQFKVKSRELAGGIQQAIEDVTLLPLFVIIDMTANQLCSGDMKVFSLKGANFQGNMGFAVVETTDDGIILARKDELLAALAESKRAKSLDLMYLAVVNIVALHSTLLLIGPDETSLARMAFPPQEGGAGPTEDPGLYSLGGLVSRKKDFIPVISRVVNKDSWGPDNNAL
jgi:manganese-dependent inorganic pyrophosphatase